MIYLQLPVLVFALAFSSFTAQVYANNNQPRYYMKNNQLIQGYDPVSYFAPDGPKKGINKFKSSLGKGEVLFVSLENKKAFDENPSKYIPAYNGYCAYAIAQDKFYKINPKSFKIIDGKVYLFYENFLVKTLKKWNKDEVNLKAKADLFWQAQVVNHGK